MQREFSNKRGSTTRVVCLRAHVRFPPDQKAPRALKCMAWLIGDFPDKGLGCINKVNHAAIARQLKALSYHHHHHHHHHPLPVSQLTTAANKDSSRNWKAINYENEPCLNCTTKRIPPHLTPPPPPPPSPTSHPSLRKPTNSSGK